VRPAGPLDSSYEIDFVLYGPECFWAIEVKNTIKLNKRMLKGTAPNRRDPLHSV